MYASLAKSSIYEQLQQLSELPAQIFGTGLATRPTRAGRKLSLCASF
jgi:hypothetical protein